MNLTSAITELDKEIMFVKNKYTNELNELEHVRAMLMKRNTGCLKCNGTGKVVRRDENNSTEYKTIELVCNVCNGTGLINSVNESDVQLP